MFFLILFFTIISFLSTITLFILGINHYAIFALGVFIISIIFLIIYYIKNKETYKRHKERTQECIGECASDVACSACSPKCDCDCGGF